MEKKIFSVAFILIAVTSCAKMGDDPSVGSVATYDPKTINFTTQITKATSNSVDSLNMDRNGIIVYGVEVNDSDWYENLDGNRYVYNSDTLMWEWQSSDAPSWSDTFDQMNFYAHYPASALGFSPSVTAPSSIIGDIVVEPSITDQTDFLASSSGDIVTKPITGIIYLSFTHIMSKISFSVLQEDGVLTIIRQLGIENVINEGSYDYINSEWLSLDNTKIGSFDDYVGSDGPFAKDGVQDQADPIRTDDHYLMLIPQSAGDKEGQTPIWDGSITVNDSGELIPKGAYISIRYRINDSTSDLIGYAIRESSPNETEWNETSYHYPAYKRDGGTYTGPLYVKAAFKFTSEQLNWVAGTEYNYTIQLNQSGGIYLSEYYHDVDGTNTKIRVNGSPKVGDPVYATDINAGITVEGWNKSEYELYL